MDDGVGATANGIPGTVSGFNIYAQAERIISNWARP